MKLFITCCLLLLPAQLWAANSQQTLTEANTIFHQAMASQDENKARTLFEKALLRYEKLYNEFHNPRLAYNMGNCALRLGDIGRAIVAYRRAQVDLPNDENLAHNLHYARSLRIDQVETTKSPNLLSRLAHWHQQLDYPWRLRLLAFFYLAFWGSLAIFFLQRRYMPPGIILTLLFIMLLLATSVGLQRFSAPQPAGVIVSPEVVARQGDGVNYEPSFTTPLHDGTEFILLERRGRWLHVRLAAGRQCWLPAASCEII